MPIDQSVLKRDKNRFLQVDSRQSVGEAFLLLASPEVNGQGWWHLVALMPDGSWAAVRFSRSRRTVFARTAGTTTSARSAPSARSRYRSIYASSGR